MSIANFIIQKLTLRMHAPEGYGSRSLSMCVCVCVCLSVCLSVTTCLVISFIFMLQK